MIRYTSALLFHGPSARQTALKEASYLGRLLRDPIGEEGLKIGEAREIAELIDFTPLGDSPGVLVIGPMCRAGRGVPDVLLKSLEEFDPNRIRPLLWAHAEAEVISPVRSRCVLRWCPGEEVFSEELIALSRKVSKASLEGDISTVIEGVKDQDPESLLRGIAMVLSTQKIGEGAQKLWESVREALSVRDPSLSELLSALLPREAS